MKKTFQTHIIQRFMDDSHMDEFLNVYNSKRLTSGREKREVNDLDRQIYKDYKEGMILAHLVKKYDRSYSAIHKSLELARAEESKLVNKVELSNRL